MMGEAGACFIEQESGPDQSPPVEGLKEAVHVRFGDLGSSGPEPALDGSMGPLASILSLRASLATEAEKIIDEEHGRQSEHRE